MSPDLHHLSGAYAVDALDTDERSAFEQHLAACEACRSEVDELCATAHSLAAVAEAAPSAALRANILASIAQVRPLAPLATDGPAEGAADDDQEPVLVGAPAPLGGEAGVPSEGAKVIPLFRRPATWIAAAAAAVLVAFGGVAVLGSGDSQAPTLTAIQQVQEAPDAASVTSHKGDLTATLEYSRELDKSALSVAGMPPAPEGMTYQLWYVGSDEIARSAGFITADGSGSGEVLLQGSVSGAAAVGVTVEPAGGSPSPTSDPIMVMAVA